MQISERYNDTNIWYLQRLREDRQLAAIPFCGKTSESLELVQSVRQRISRSASLDYRCSDGVHSGAQKVGMCVRVPRNASGRLKYSRVVGVNDRKYDKLLTVKSDQ